MRPLDMRSFAITAERSLARHLYDLERKSLLRFITCGSVDDGKSTLIGRLLYDTHLICDDQLTALATETRRGGGGAALDFALLVDGLSAEREQGITIDVAHRYFATPRRKFIVADTPGHEQYTRNMITGASTADLAVILVDARHGVRTQTHRHSYLVSLIGIRHVVLAVNKMDLVDYSRDVFDAIVAEYRPFAERIGLPDFIAIPISARDGDNVAFASTTMPWYSGPSLVEHLDTVDVEVDRLASPFRMFVQWVNRPNSAFRGYCGTIASGRISCGDSVHVLPGARESRISRIVTREGDLVEAMAGQSVTLTIDDEFDISRGDLFCNAGKPPQVTDHVEATVVWMADQPMTAGRPYWLRIGARLLTATIISLDHCIDVNTLAPTTAQALALNMIGVCHVKFDQPVPVEPYTDNAETGGFVLIDRLTNATIGAGLVRFVLQRTREVHWQTIDIDKRARAALKSQTPFVVWFTGISGAGKSTIANLVERRLHAAGHHTTMLDGDNVRHGLNKDLGFSGPDRAENLRRAAEVAKLMVDAGLIVMVSFISPFAAERRLARALFDSGEFIEVFVDTPLAVAEARDPKRLYAKARRGEIADFTGVDSDYERPDNPDITVDTATMSADTAAELIIARLAERGFARVV
jgi:bifunctional enzyme CysN/CysC